MDINKKTIKELAEASSNVREMAKSLGVTVGEARYWLKRFDVVLEETIKENELIDGCEASEPLFDDGENFYKDKHESLYDFFRAAKK